MEYYTIPRKKGFHPGIYILYVGTNDLTIDNTLKEVIEHYWHIAISLKTEYNTVAMSNIVHVAIAKKLKTESVNKLLIGTCEQKQIHLTFNAYGKSIFF